MHEIVRIGGAVSHARLIQLFGEIESLLERGVAIDALDEFQQWIDDNEIFDGDALWDALEAAARYCRLSYHDFQVIGIPLEKLCEHAAAIVAMTPTAHLMMDAHGVLSDLYRFVRGYRAELEWRAASNNYQAPSAEPSSNGKAKGTPGRKRDLENDAKIYNEYHDGKNQGLWESQSEYLRQKHREKWGEGQNNANSWLSQLLKRYEQRLRELK